MIESVVCEACGAKVRASHARCPRCRAFLTKAPPGPARGAGVASQGSAQKIAAIALALTVVTVGVVWLRQEPEPAAPVATPADPLSARRARGATATTGRDPQQGAIPPDPRVTLPAQLALGSGDNDTGALAGFRVAAERNPEDAQAFYDIGRMLLRLGRPQEALGPLQRAAELGADQWRFAFTYAYACALAERWPEAVTAFRRVKTAMPNDPTASYNLALALQRLTNYSGAVEEYNTAIRLDSAAPQPRLGLAISLDRLGKAADAVAAYRDCMRLLPEGPEADRVHARIVQLGG